MVVQPRRPVHRHGRAAGLRPVRDGEGGAGKGEEEDGLQAHPLAQDAEGVRAQGECPTCFVLCFPFCSLILCLPNSFSFSTPQVDLDAFTNAVAWDTLSEEETKVEKIKCARASRDAKKRMLGNIKFIGELFRQQMLSPKIMHHCLTTLLKEMDHPEEAYIECCVNLLRSVGKLIDVKAGKACVELGVCCSVVLSLARARFLASSSRMCAARGVSVRPSVRLSSAAALSKCRCSLVLSSLAPTAPPLTATSRPTLSASRFLAPTQSSQRALSLCARTSARRAGRVGRRATRSSAP